MHPYRTPDTPPPERPPEMPSEEKFLIGLLVVIGGVRVLFAAIAGKPMDAEPTVGLMMVLAGLYSGLRIGRWRYKRRSGKLHDHYSRDRADHD